MRPPRSSCGRSALVQRECGAGGAPGRTRGPQVTARRCSRLRLAGRALRSLGPVFLRGAARSWRISRSRIAALLSLPRDGARASPSAARAPTRTSARCPRGSAILPWTPTSPCRESVRSSPRARGLELDVPMTARALLRAATSPVNRTATLAIARAEPSARPPRRWRWASTGRWAPTRRTTRGRRTESRTCGSASRAWTGRSFRPEERFRSTRRSASVRWSVASGRRR